MFCSLSHQRKFEVQLVTGFCKTLLLSDLELLPGVIPLCREHGRGGLHPLNHYLLAQLLFAFAWSILIAGLRKTQENIYRHLLVQVQ